MRPNWEGKWGVGIENDSRSVCGWNCQSQGWWEEPVSGNDLGQGCGEFDLPAEHLRDIMAGLEGLQQIWWSMGRRMEAKALWQRDFPEDCAAWTQTEHPNQGHRHLVGGWINVQRRGQEMVRVLVFPISCELSCPLLGPLSRMRWQGSSRRMCVWELSCILFG